MSDYIDREDAIKAFDPLQRRDWYTPWIVETLEDLPPADVAPVRHGRWIEYGENKDGTHNICCSVCDDQRKIRIFNSIGSLLFIVYGLLVGALSNIVLNGTLLGIHFYKLHKMGKENKYGETSERD